MKSYELHTQKNGKWKIDSVYDNAESAMHEAKRAQSTGRYNTIRLIEEHYDESENQTTTKTIFFAECDKEPAAKAPSKPTVKAEPKQKPQAAPAGEWKSAKPRPAVQKSAKLPRMIITLGLILVLGVAILYGLEFLYQSY